jgi:ABC-type sugar transport system ATPase subunit
LKIEHPRDAIEKGIGYVPEERKNSGLFMEMDVASNIVSADLSRATSRKLYKSSMAVKIAKTFISRLNIKTPSSGEKIVNLSGGNQQKVVLAKWLLTEPDILIVDEPTHGIDVGAKNEVYDILNTLAAAGKGILLISSELPELLSVCDRILVIKAGMIAGELSRDEATEEKVLALAM